MKVWVILANQVKIFVIQGLLFLVTLFTASFLLSSFTLAAVGGFVFIFVDDETFTDL